MSSRAADTGILAAAPSAESLFQKGVRFWGLGDRQSAIACLDAALARKPDYPAALCMAAYVLNEMGNSEAAIRFYRQALHLDASQVSAWSNLGKLLFAARRYEDALRCFETACDLSPDDADFWNSRAGALRESGLLAGAAEAARRALALRPNFAEAALNLGNALLKLDQMGEALEAYQRACEIDPSFASACCGRALALRALGRRAEAREAFTRGEQLGSREATNGKGCLDLSEGDFENGWEGYEARWIGGLTIAEALGVKYPLWQGPGDRAGETVLVINDHGLGDTIQFVRYLPLMAGAGVKPVFACPPKLQRLVSSLIDVPFVERCATDYCIGAQIAVSSLPRAFKTRLDTVPARTPYLHPEPALRKHWAERIGIHGFKVGVVWQGNPNPEADQARSMPLSFFAPLAAIEGVRLISLQKGFGVEQLGALAPAMRVESLGDGFDSGPDAFIDTAAVMACLDLVVTCDTSIAHLAGALNCPVWVALKKDAEWRWLIDRQDSPWYPSMRLFRQPQRGDWASVFEAMATALRGVLAGKAAAGQVTIPTPIGELIDKIAILEIKAERIADEHKLDNVRRELRLLEQCERRFGLKHPRLPSLRAELKHVNERLWEIEDAIRVLENKGLFDAEFVALARAVYKNNDQRAALKREINALLGSDLVEEKSYP